MLTFEIALDCERLCRVHLHMARKDELAAGVTICTGFRNQILRDCMLYAHESIRPGGLSPVKPS